MVVCPGGVLVVEGAGLEAAVQDAGEPVGQLAQRGVVALAAAPELVVVGPGAGGGGEGAEGLLVQGVGEPVVADVAGQHGFLLAGGAGDRASAGVVLAGLGVGVAVLVIAELTEGPGRQNRSQAGLGPVDLSVPGLPKTL